MICWYEVKLLSDVGPNNSTTVPSSSQNTTVAQVRGGTWTLCEWVVGLLVIGSHGILDGDSTMPHSSSHSILLKVHHPGRTMSRRAAPCRGGWRRKWLAARPEIDSPPAVHHLPSHRARHRCHTTTKTEQINVHWWCAYLRILNRTKLRKCWKNLSQNT